MNSRPTRDLVAAPDVPLNADFDNGLPSRAVSQLCRCAGMAN